MKAILTLEIEIDEDAAIDAAYRTVGALLGALVDVARESGATVAHAYSTIAQKPEDHAAALLEVNR